MKPSLFIDHKPASFSEFILPEMSLSSSRSTMIKHEFEMVFDGAEVIEKLREKYAIWVEESIEDDRMCGSPQDELALAGYPELEEVIQQKELLNLVIGGYLFEDLMAAYQTEEVLSQYWYDQVVSTKLIDQSISIKGICYSKS